MNELEQTKIALELLQNQKETFALLWGVVLTVGTVLSGAVGVLFKLYIDANNKRAENEKEHLKSLNVFSETIKDLTFTLKETNSLAKETLRLINNPIIPTLDNIEKRKN